MLTFILGGCGTGKSTMMMERMKTDIKNGEEVQVLVPEQFSFEAEKSSMHFTVQLISTVSEPSVLQHFQGNYLSFTVRTTTQNDMHPIMRSLCFCFRHSGIRSDVVI